MLAFTVGKGSVLGIPAQRSIAIHRDTSDSNCTVPRPWMHGQKETTLPSWIFKRENIREKNTPDIEAAGGESWAWVKSRAGNRDHIFWFSNYHLIQEVMLLIVSYTEVHDSMLIQKATLESPEPLSSWCMSAKPGSTLYIWIFMKDYSLSGFYWMARGWLKYFLLSKVLGCWYRMPWYSFHLAVDGTFINTRLSEWTQQ